MNGGTKEMKNELHASPHSVTEAHRNSNIVILRFAPPFSGKKGGCTTRSLGINVTIMRMDTGSPAEA